MGEIVELPGPLGLSLKHEARQRRVCTATGFKYRKRDGYPHERVVGINGHVYRSRQLSKTERARRDRNTRLALSLGVPHSVLVERFGVSKGTVSRVAQTTRKRRNLHRYSQRHWRNRLDRATG